MRELHRSKRDGNEIVRLNELIDRAIKWSSKLPGFKYDTDIVETETHQKLMQGIRTLDFDELVAAIEQGE